MRLQAGDRQGLRAHRTLARIWLRQILAQAAGDPAVQVQVVAVDEFRLRNAGAAGDAIISMRGSSSAQRL
jgi:hypothetical protein